MRDPWVAKTTRPARRLSLVVVLLEARDLHELKVAHLEEQELVQGHAGDDKFDNQLGAQECRRLVDEYLDVLIGMPNAPVLTIKSIRSTSDSLPTKGGYLTRARSVITGLEGPEGLGIDSLTVETSILTNGTKKGTKVSAATTVAGLRGGGQPFSVPSEGFTAVTDGLNTLLRPAGVMVAPPLTCTNRKCKGVDVAGFDIIGGTRFCAGGPTQLCALAHGPELRFTGPAGSPLEGHRYVLTLGRAFAQGSAQPAPQR